jgi:NTP pyrophosphatase (non-canonical NTP hydrolase)
MPRLRLETDNTWYKSTMDWRLAMRELVELMAEVAAFRDARDWTRGHTPENLAKSIVVEAAELLELFQWHPPTAEAIKHNDDLQERVSEELADVLIYILSLANQTGIDPADAIRSKLRKNAVKYPLRIAQDPMVVSVQRMTGPDGSQQTFE